MATPKKISKYAQKIGKLGGRPSKETAQASSNGASKPLKHGK